MRIVDYVKPESLEEAVKILHEMGDKAIIMAGGTAFQFFTSDAERTAIFIDFEELKGIRESDGSFEIGALSSISDIRDFSAKGWVLDEVAKKFVTQQIRNSSTLSGNIARIFPWSDFPVALLVLDAQIETFNGKDKQNYTSEKFFEIQPARLLDNKQVITAVKVLPLQENSGFGYHKEVRTAAAFSTLTCAATVKYDAGKIIDVKIAVGASGMPMRLTEIENNLKDKKADSGVIEKVVGDFITKYSWKGKEGATDSYAKHLAEVKVTDVLIKALSNAKGDM